MDFDVKPLGAIDGPTVGQLCKSTPKNEIGWLEDGNSILDVFKESTPIPFKLLSHQNLLKSITLIPGHIIDRRIGILLDYIHGRRNCAKPHGLLIGFFIKNSF